MVQHCQLTFQHPTQINLVRLFKFKKKDLFLKDQKPKTKYIDTEKKTVTVLDKFNAWDLPVPMDFTGKIIMWLEYTGDNHTLKLFDCITQETKDYSITDEEKNKHSHIKFFNKDDKFVSIRNYKNVKLV